MTTPRLTILIIALLALAGPAGGAQECPPRPAELPPVTAMDPEALDLALRCGWVTADGPIDVPDGAGPMTTLRALISRLGANPGTGYSLQPGAVACWEGGRLPGRRTYPIDLTARPWGPTGNGSFDRATYDRRYRGGREDETGWPCGLAGELLQQNGAILSAACNGRIPELAYLVQPAGRDCRATTEEILDLAVTQRRCTSPVYRTWHRFNRGGTAENPLPGNKWLARQEGWCAPGLYTLAGILCGWTQYYEVDAELVEGAEWCEDQPPPPPPVEECEPYAGSECESRCGVIQAGRCQRAGTPPEECPLMSPAECLSLAARNPDSVLGRLCEGVSIECEEPPPPEPVRCYLYAVSEPSEVEQRFTPGVPSTGRLEIMLILPGGWSPTPCPEETPETTSGCVAYDPVAGMWAEIPCPGGEG